MTIVALVLHACALLGIREPAEFYALSDTAQGLWLAHARALVTGAYQHGPGAAERRQGWERGAIEAARARGAL